MQRIKAIVLFGLIALTAVITFAGCDNPAGGEDDTPGNSWTEIPVPTDKKTLTDALDWIRDNAVDWGAYTVTVTSGVTISEQSLSYNGKRVRITLKGNGAAPKVTLKDDRDENRDRASLFIVRRGVTLAVENLTLSGWGIDGGEDGANKSALVQVNAGGVLNLKAGAVITGNYNRDSGGAVIVNQNAAFIMEDGEIKDSKAREGGGVEVRGTFTMKGGVISGNEAERGGGVRVGDNATFILEGGEIKSNTAPEDAGGGVEVRGTFTMKGGEVSGNEAERGGGVRVGDNAIFTLENGAIKTNKAEEGGGVKVNENAIFIMEDGVISGNTAANNGGGGVDVYKAAFTMKGGTISGNTAKGGGGVRADRDAIFTLENGTISGNTATDWGGGGVQVSDNNGTFTKKGGTISKNTATNGAMAVQLNGDDAKKRDADADEGVKLYARRVNDRWTYNDSSPGGVGDTSANWEEWD
jgi:hypothetical protein